MGMVGPSLNTKDSADSARQNPSRTGPYTGVVLIHGLGIEQRNDTLQEALNGITYWFNHKSGLEFRPTGPGRIWVETRLTLNSNVDADCSQATVWLEPPAMSGRPPSAPLRLELHEVWWAQSFGLPSASHVLSWTLLQFFQVADRLSPISSGSGRLRVLHRDDRGKGDDPHGTFSSTTAPTPSRRYPLDWLIKAPLSVYDGAQYVVNLLAWLIGLPMIVLLLLVAMLFDKVAGIPGIPTIIQGVQSFFTLLSLHWLGSMQIYMEDYTWSSSLRERFQRELTTFMDDPACESIVVIAHSMGTVIAYEGLTTALELAGNASAKKQIRFATLAVALRRLWQVARTDPRRLRGVLPMNVVTWYDFWARLDPVCAGPLDRTAIPRAHDWMGSVTDPDPVEKIRVQLDEDVQHIAVVNRDNLFLDHISYWQNLEQVVGPIARLLVDGHPDLEAHVERHLATKHAILMRRARIATRNTAALILAVAAFYEVMFVNSVWAWLSENVLAKALLGLRNLIGDALASVFAPIAIELAKVGAVIQQASQGDSLASSLALFVEAWWNIALRLNLAILAAYVAIFVVSTLFVRSEYRFFSPHTRYREPWA